jgi:exodeoxyribonuclease VII large subunit
MTPSPTPLTVSALADAVQGLIEDGFPFVEVTGEVSGVKIPASGHVYFSLKDSNAVLAAVAWRGMAAAFDVKPEDGMAVVAGGRLTTFAAQSRYQLIVETLRVAGEGALLKELEARKKRLLADGIFDAARKQPLPRYPQVIGLITSPTGAVIRDMLHRINDRWPLRVLLYPITVQGANAAPEALKALAYFNAMTADDSLPRPDVLIIARGGGSFEDLWCFNDEALCRAAASSTIPVISAIGHETDTTLLDFAADARAPTPTAAAEMATPDRRALAAGLAQMTQRLRRLREVPARLEQRLDDLHTRRRNSLNQLSQRAGLKLERYRLAAAGQRLLERTATHYHTLNQRLHPGLLQRLADQQTHTLNRTARILHALSYRGTLARGFALVRTPDGHLITSTSQWQKLSKAEIVHANGTVMVQPIAPKHKTATIPPYPQQGELF